MSPVFPEYPIIVLSLYYLVNNNLGDILTTTDVYTPSGLVILILSLLFLKNPDLAFRAEFP